MALYKLLISISYLLVLVVILPAFGADQAKRVTTKRGPRTFYQTSKCMQNVTGYCSRKCAAQEEHQKMYVECLTRRDVADAYNQSFEVFHKCVGGQKPCMKLNVTGEFGHDCWSKCSGHGYQSCLQGCKEIQPESDEGQAYLQCATQMNDAHGLFWQCLQEYVQIQNGTSTVPVTLHKGNGHPEAFQENANEKAEEDNNNGPTLL